MTNFQMNDKCAAGTGRFLDVMARVLEVKVSDLAPLGAQSTKRVPISSTCTVFAESEVISQLSKGTNKSTSLPVSIVPLPAVSLVLSTASGFLQTWP